MVRDTFGLGTHWAHLTFLVHLVWDTFGPGTHWAHWNPLVPGFIWSKIPLVPGHSGPIWLLWSQDSFGPRTYWTDLARLVHFIHLVHYFIWSLTRLVLWLVWSPFHLVRGLLWSFGSFGLLTPLVPFGPKESADQRKRSPYNQPRVKMDFRHIYDVQGSLSSRTASSRTNRLKIGSVGQIFEISTV